MKHLLTPFLTLALVLAGVTSTYAQDAGPPLGDDFIFFVNEVNTMVPMADGNVVDDPADATNKVIEYPYSDFFFGAFRFPSDVGVDMSKNRMDGDILHARIWVHPDNAGKGRVHIMFEDKTDGSGADDGSADLPFRLVWQIPESMRNGMWHEISVPFPPATYAELEAAKAAKELDGLDSLWVYAGAWSSGQFSVGLFDRLGPNTTEKPELWKEFEWTNVQNLGVQFDHNTGGGPIYIDDVYIGNKDLDLSATPGPALGDDFVFFVEGVNTMVPEFNGAIIDDPTDPDNKVMQYNYENWSFQAFRFPPAVGVDMSKNRMDGDVLHARIWVDPANAGQERVQLMMEDKAFQHPTDAAEDDLPFRLVWRIPENMRDGQWHEISVPLPPATYTELEDAKSAMELDGLDSLWKYVGAWSGRGADFSSGVEDELGPNTMHNPELWKEYEWTNVQNLGVHFDNDTGGGPIYLDDVYIGAKDLDLSGNIAPPPPAMGVSATAMADSNVVSWASVEGAGGYKVYYSLTAITDVEAVSVGLVAQVDGNTTSASHKFKLPHSSLGPLTLHYAVTTLNDSGVENNDISMSTASVANENLPTQGYITELTEDQANHLSDLLFDDSFEDIADGFPEDYKPIVINMENSKPGDGGMLSEDDDLSGKLWAGYSADPPELYLYVEVTDDQISLQAAGGNPADGWQHDSIEFGWGNYDVRKVPLGGIFTGSPHTNIARGEFADYQFRIGGLGDGTKAGTEAYAYVGWSIDAAPQGGGAIYDQRMDASGAVAGYKILSLFPLDQIQSVDSMDAVTPLPTGDEIGYYPFNFVLNDGDGGNRDNQIQWSIKANADGQWWNTPAQWPAVALVGMATEDEDTTRVDVAVEELPGEIVLDQNYPNPFNPTTSIQFSLPAAETVTLRVFDSLGRTVTTLLDRKPHMAGKHMVQFDAEGLASGVYFYRLEAGSSVLMTRRMLLLK